MQIGIIGLGRMGGNIARRLMRAGHRCVVFDQQPGPVQTLIEAGAEGGQDLAGLVAQLEKPRVVWVMLPAGDITEQTVVTLGQLLEAGDIVIDGGNSFYQDDIRRAQALKEKGVFYVDAGTSGGVWGLERGYCLMIGGDTQIVRSSPPWRPARGMFPRPPAGWPTARSAAICIAVPTAPAISSRWCITGSNTA